MGVALDDLDENVAAVLGGGNVDCPPGGDGSLGSDNGDEDLLTGLVEGDDTNGVGDVGDGGDGGVGGLVDVLGLVLLDQAGLESGTAGVELGGVDSGGGGGRSEDLGALGEEVAEVGGDAGSVGGTAGENDLVDIESIEASLLDGGVDKAGEALEDGAGNGLVAEAVDGAGEVDAVGEGLDAEAGVGAQAEGLLGGLSLGLELGERAGVLAGVDLVLLDELLGEVVDEDLVEGGAVEVVVVNGGEDGVHAAAAGDNGNVGAGATKVGNNNDLVLDLGLGAGIVGESSGNGLADELENLEVGGGGSSEKSLLLLVGEVGGDGHDGGGDLLAKVLGGGIDQAAEVAGRDLGDGELGRLSILTLLLLDGEGNGALDILGVGRGVVVGRVDGGEVLAEEVLEVGDGVLGVPDEEVLGLLAVVLIAVDVGQDGGDLAVCTRRVMLGDVAFRTLREGTYRHPRWR